MTTVTKTMKKTKKSDCREQGKGKGKEKEKEKEKTELDGIRC